MDSEANGASDSDFTGRLDVSNTYDWNSCDHTHRHEPDLGEKPPTLAPCPCRGERLHGRHDYLNAGTLVEGNASAPGSGTAALNVMRRRRKAVQA